MDGFDRSIDRSIDRVCGKKTSNQVKPERNWIKRRKYEEKHQKIIAKPKKRRTKVK